MSEEANQEIWVNGETRRLPEPASLAGLVAAMGLDTRRIAVELNRQIIPRSLHASTMLSAGDIIEIVGFIGGG